MKKWLYLMVFFLLIGAGCTQTVQEVAQTEVIREEDEISVIDDLDVVFPIENYVNGRTQKVFGEYIEDRFVGFHVGEDVEFSDVEREVPVYAIAQGTILRKQTVSGYGGLIVAEHTVGTDVIHALYGHVDLQSSPVEVGQTVEKGQFLANLGDHLSAETDGERKHIHFGLIEAGDVQVLGYVPNEDQVNDWINPHAFFVKHGLDATSNARMFDPDVDLGGDIYNLSFEIPAGWEVEYVPSIQSLNLFPLDGDGIARERSQIFIRYFDADEFLTLSTVEILDEQDVLVGDGYEGRMYEIEKLRSANDFVDQPSWRNERHVVTDFRAKNGETRYYVFAANPELSPEIYNQVLSSITIR